MDKLMYVFIGLFLPLVISAQSAYQKATEVQKKEIISKIAHTSKTMKTMKCDFTQVKELSFMDEKVSSEGKMLYKQADKIRWEYTKPYVYVFAMDGRNIYMNSGNGTNKIPARSSKLFNEISNIMIGGVSGAGLVDSPDFSTLFSVGKDNYLVTLTPLKKEVKDLFASILLYISKTDNHIHEVELVEKSGDKTSIKLKNIQVNTTINDEIFTH